MKSSVHASRRCRRDQLFEWVSRYMKWISVIYSPAAAVSHHQQQQAATSARAPAISATAHHTRALAGRPGGLRAAPRDRCPLAPLEHAPSESPLSAPLRASPRLTPRNIFRVSLESARAALFSGGSLTAPNWLDPFVCRIRFRSVPPQRDSTSSYLKTDIRSFNETFETYKLMMKDTWLHVLKFLYFFLDYLKKFPSHKFSLYAHFTVFCFLSM